MAEEDDPSGGVRLPESGSGERRQRGAAGGGKSWISGGLEFDTKGIKDFTKEIERAEKAVGTFVGHFKELKEALKSLPQDKIDALSAMGQRGGMGGGSYTSGYQAMDFNAINQRLSSWGGDRSNVNYPGGGGGGGGGDEGGASGGNTNRFGGVSQRFKGLGVEQLYFGSEIIQSIGGRVGGYAQQQMSTASALSAITGGAAMRSSRYDRADFNRANIFSDQRGAMSREDAFAAGGTIMSAFGGASSTEQMRRLATQRAGANLYAPYGSAEASAGAYMQNFDASSLWSQRAFGVQPAMVGGKARDADEFMKDVILRATGKEKFGAGGLTSRQAGITFDVGGRARQNLSVILGRQLSEAEYQEYAQMAGGLAETGGNAEAWRRQYEDTPRVAEAEETREAIRRDVNAAVEGEASLERMTEMRAEVVQTVGDITDNFQDIINYGSAAAGILSDVAGGLTSIGGLTRLGGGGGDADTTTPWAVTASKPYPASYRSSMPRPEIGDADTDSGAAVGKASSNPFQQDLPGKGREAGLNSDFRRRLGDLFYAANRAGYRLTLTSGFRTREEQERLYQKYLNGTGNLAAKPGTSRHESGFAADVGVNFGKISGTPAAKWLRANAPKFGLKIPMPSREPWHVSMDKGMASTDSTYGGGGEDAGAPGGGEGGKSAGFSAMHRFFGGSDSLMTLVENLSKAPGFAASFGSGSAPGAEGTDTGTGGTLTGKAYQGGAISQQQAFDLAKAAGFSDAEARVMSAIAVGESGLNPSAHNPDASTGDNSYGLWQINMLGKMGPARRRSFGISRNEELFDPLTNAKAAKKIHESQGFRAWSVYKSGKHLPYMTDEIGDPVSESPGGGGGRGSSGNSMYVGGKSVTIQNLNLNVMTEKVSDEEARRLARMVHDYLNDEDALTRLGGG